LYVRVMAAAPAVIQVLRELQAARAYSLTV